MFRYMVVMSVAVMMVTQACFAGTACDPGSGKWLDLFNGKDLTGWMSAEKKDYAGLTSSKEGTGWVVDNGVLVRKDKSGNIWTKQRFSDFILDLELNTTGNSGILFRCDDPTNYVQTSIEIDEQQVIDMDLNKWDTPEKNPDGSKNKFKKALKDFKREGHIGLQDHNSSVQYRNIKIKVLK